MKSKSERTKNLADRLKVLRLADWLLLVAPLLIYIVIGLSEGDVVYKKVALVGTIVIAAVVVIINILFKFSLRSPIWIVVIGLYIAVKNIIPMLICVACATILDEFVFTPLIKKTKTQLIANKEIDLREKATKKVK